MAIKTRETEFSLKSRWAAALSLGLLLFAVRQPAAAQLETSDLRPQSVVATVGNEQILWKDVQFQLKQTLGDRQLDAQATQVALAASARQLINQLIVSDYLQDRQQFAVSDEILDGSMQRLQSELQRVNSSIEQMLVERGESMNHLKQQMRWQASWDRYLKHYLNRENLQKYFDKRKTMFDGTKMRVAHIVLVPDSDSDQSAEQQKLALLKQAESIRAELVAGSSSWSAAVQSYSAAKHNDEQGDLGWIERRQPMPDVFSAAAFKLQPDEISPAVVTSFGVHLIKCLEIEPGQLKLSDVEDEVRSAATQFLFEFLVDEHQSQVRINVSSRIPHFDLKTGAFIAGAADK